MESRKTQVMAIQQNQFFDNLPQLKKQLRLIEEDHLTYIPFEEYGRYRFPREEIKKYSLVYYFTYEIVLNKFLCSKKKTQIDFFF